MSLEKKIERFDSLLRSTGRDGIEELIAYLHDTDFYQAPASTRFHSCHEGGLVEHSLNVCKMLLSKRETVFWEDVLDEVGEDGLIIIGLLHDVCKANFYEIDYRNKKVYSDSGTKKDAKGWYDWETVPFYTTSDQMPYGHGEKSVAIIEDFIELSEAERFAIRWHMGFTEPKESYNTLGNAIRLYPIIIAVHLADLEATYLLEEE